MSAETLAWLAGALIVFVAASAIWRIVARLLFAFTACAAVLLYFHYQTNPGEAIMAGAALGGAHLARWPLAKVLGGLG